MSKTIKENNCTKHRIHCADELLRSRATDGDSRRSVTYPITQNISDTQRDLTRWSPLSSSNTRLTRQVTRDMQHYSVFGRNLRHKHNVIYYIAPLGQPWWGWERWSSHWYIQPTFWCWVYIISMFLLSSWSFQCPSKLSASTSVWNVFSYSEFSTNSVSSTMSFISARCVWESTYISVMSWASSSHTSTWMFSSLEWRRSVPCHQAAATHSLILPTHVVCRPSTRIFARCHALRGRGRPRPTRRSVHQRHQQHHAHDDHFYQVTIMFLRGRGHFWLTASYCFQFVLLVTLFHVCFMTLGRREPVFLGVS